MTRAHESTPGEPTAGDEVEAVIERYRAGFSDLDGDRLAGIWDRDYDKLVYVALEEPRARRGWDAIADYYAELRSGPVVRASTMNLYDLSVDVLGEVAHAFCRFEFSGEQGGARFVIEGRSSFILRRRDDAWRVIHYHESAAQRGDASA